MGDDDSQKVQWEILSQSTSSSAGGRTTELAELLARADFQAVLNSPEGRAVLSSPNLYGALPLDLESDKAGPSTSNANIDDLTQLIVAVALLHSFVQSNWTGPDLDLDLLDLVPSSGSTTLANLNEASVSLLTLGGEPAYHLASHPILLLLALRILKSCSDLVSLAWWRLRFHIVHISLLDDPIELPPRAMEELKTLRQALPEDPDLVAQYHLEIGLYHHALGQDKLANSAFLEASRASGLEFQLTGALGKKTKFQINPLSQLVLLAESRPRQEDGKSPLETREESIEENEVEAESSMPETLALNDDTLLEETEFTQLNPSPTSPTSPSTRLSHLDPSAQPPLHPLDQSLLLSLCLSQHNQTPESGLTASQMMPFISRVVTHPRNWSVHTVALLLRSRLESTRSRTVERSAMQLAALIEQMPTSDSSTQERLKYYHQLPLPSRWAMEKELAKRYLSLGVVRSALDIFTRLEMWEDAVACLQLMERDDEAEKIVQDLLDGKIIESDLVMLQRQGMSEARKTKLSSGREAKLWCLLGDLALSSDTASKDPQAAGEKAMECYDKSWAVSGETFSRAIRSKGALYFSAKEYDRVVDCLRKALEINPLYARTWFTLGVSLVRLERWTEARDAFQRQVGVDEEDAEGWNNLAAVYLRLYEDRTDETTASTPFSDRLLAFRALRQGLKFAPTNWRMWSNYMLISADVGELAESARAMGRLFDSRKDTNVPVMGETEYDALDKLVDSVTRDEYSLQRDGQVMPKTSNEGFGLLPILERLFDQSILTRVSDSPRVWRAHGRLMRWKEEWAAAMEDYTRAFRYGPASSQNVETDREKFKEAVEELEELVGVIQVLGPKVKMEEGKKGDWRFQARGLVRTFIGRTKGSFEDEPAMEKLKTILDELKRAE